MYTYSCCEFSILENRMQSYPENPVKMEEEGKNPMQ